MQLRIRIVLVMCLFSLLPSFRLFYQYIFYSALIFVVELVSCFYLDCDAGLQSLFVC